MTPAPAAPLIKAIAFEILFVSANAWDACAATCFGFTTFGVNRSQQPADVLDVSPTATGRQLSMS